MSKASELKAISKQMVELRDRQQKIEDETFEREVLPVLKTLPGKTFVYRDNTTGGSERWDVFRKVREVIVPEKGCVYIVSDECEVGYEGRPSIKIDVHYFYQRHQPENPFYSGWRPCRVEEYDQAYKRAMDELLTLDACRAALQKRS